MPHLTDELFSLSHEVTQGLLESQRGSRATSSFDSDPANHEILDRSQHIAEPPELTANSQHHQSIQSSGTWTTLSREAWSDKDEIDDREIFVAEFNRLAKKVRDDFTTDSGS